MSEQTTASDLSAIKSRLNEIPLVIDAEVIALVTIDLVVCISAIFGNTLVIVSVLRFPRLRTKTNMFVLSLAIADLLVGMCIPYYILFYFNRLIHFHCDILPCLLRLFTTLNATMTSMLSLIGVSIDRYLAIMYPYFYLRTRDISCWLILGIIAGWIYIALVCGLPLFLDNTWSDESVEKCKEGAIECDLFYATKPHFVLGTVLIHVVITMTVTLTLYSRIFREAWRQNHIVANLLHNIRFRNEVRTAKMMLFVLSACVLGFAPFMTAIIIPYFVDKQKLEKDSKWWSTLKKFAVCFYLGNSSINPVIYGWKNKEFRSAFLQLLHLSKKN